MRNAVRQFAHWLVEAKEKRPFLLFFLLAIVVYWPLSIGGYALQYDAVDVYMPWRFFGSESLREGMVPLWNPYQDGGYPMYADHQYSIWNPELLIVSLFTRFNATVIVWLFLLYISFGALGFRFLLKTLKLPTSAAFLGGAMFLLSGIIIGHSQSLVSILGAVWLPWALGMYIQALENQFRLKDTLGLVVCMFLMLAAGYQAVSIMLFYVVITLGIVHLIFVLRQKDWKQLRRFLLGHLATGVLLGILLIGIVLSLSEVFPYLSRLSGLSLEESQLVHLHPKSFGSLLYPLASVQEEYRGTSITAQNIFSGLLFFFALFYGLHFLKYYLNRSLIVLLVFGLIYGLASLGPNTPVQPFFYHYVPGCDQFFYAVFYRYFAWFILLLIACIGVHHCIERGKYKPLLWFFVAGAVLYLSSALWAWKGMEALQPAFEDEWAYTFRRLKWTPALLLDALVHLGVLTLFIVVLLWKKSVRLLPVFIVLELAIIAQLNLPVTTYGEIRSETLDRYLASKKQGFLLPSNTLTIKEQDGLGYYASLWRNLGNYTNYPSSAGYTSFRLAGRETLRKEHTEIEGYLTEYPLAYCFSDSTNVKITHFEPGKISINVPEPHGNKLIVQQANFPGWRAWVNDRPTKISTVNFYQQAIRLKPGENKVDLEFSNTRMIILFYLTQFGFLGLLFLYWGLHFRMGSGVQRFTALSLLFGAIILRTATFERSDAQQLVVRTDGKERMRKSQPLAEDYNRLWKWMERSNKLEIQDTRDDDPKLMSLLHHQFKGLKTEGSLTTCIGHAQIDTARRTISAKSYHDISIPEDYREGYLLFSLDVHDPAPALPDVYVVVELKVGERIVYAHAFPFTSVYQGEARAVFADGYLIPDLAGERYLKMYLWNNSSASFTFSNFKLGLTP